MNAKTKTLIGAAAVLVLLVGGYFAADAVQKKKSTAAPDDSFYSEQIRLTDFATFDIVKIEIPSSGIVLEKIDEKWELISPQNKSFVLEQYTVLGKLWSMANLSADKIIDEEPDDLSQFGLDDPQVRAIITDINGISTEILFGNMTPGRNLYYVMVKGDPKVYTAYPYAADNFLFSLDDLRSRELMPEFDPQTLARLILENSGTRIEAVPNDDSYPQVSVFSSFVLISPYKPHGTDNDKFGSFLRALTETRIGEFIDDEPVSLSPYGLERPGRFYFEVPEGVLDLRFGSGDDGRIYFQRNDAPGIFTVPGLEGLVHTTPFNLADKFIQLYNIDSVKDFTVSGEGRTIRAEIRGTKDDPEFFLDGRKTADQEFRQYYQSVIGLLVDAEYSGGAPSNQESITITFNFINTAAAASTVVLNPYNRDFYSVTQNGATEFMVSRSQVRNIFDFADKMVYEE